VVKSLVAENTLQVRLRTILQLALCDALDNCGIGGTTTLADGKEAIPALPSMELMHEAGHELAACTTKRVTESHRSAIDIDLFQAAIKEGLSDSQGHRSEGFVHLDHVKIGCLQSSILERSSSGWHWTFKHDDRIGAHNGKRCDLCQRLHSKLLQTCLITDKDGRCAVADLG